MSQLPNISVKIMWEDCDRHNSPSYSLIKLSSVKPYPLGPAPFKVSALTAGFISFEICTKITRHVAGKLSKRQPEEISH